MVKDGGDWSARVLVAVTGVSVFVFADYSKKER